MAKKRLGTGGEDRRQALTVWRDANVADSEDPAVKTVQVTVANSAIHRASRVTQRTRQLPDRDDAVLSLRQTWK